MRRKTKPEHGSPADLFGHAMESLESARAALEGGYEYEGRIETNIHARVGWATSAIKNAIGELHDVERQTRLKAVRS